MSSTKDQIRLYNAGYSSYQVAKLLNLKPITVRKTISTYKISRNPARQLEKRVVAWYLHRGQRVVHMPGNHKFDILLNGEKIDVKSASLTDKNGYRFEIHHEDSLNCLKDIDSYLLVFLDMENVPMYKIDADKVKVKRLLKIPLSFNSKYKLDFVGYLTKGGEYNG